MGNSLPISILVDTYSLAFYNMMWWSS